MKIPDWYGLILLALASYRTWRLLAEDDILDRPRRWILKLENPDWDPDNPRKAWTGDQYREALARFISCPWCLGFWLTLAWWGVWQIEDFWVTVAAVPMAISALVPLIERVTSSD